MRVLPDRTQSSPNTLRAITVLVLVIVLVLFFTYFRSAEPPAHAQSTATVVQDQAVGVKCVSCHRPYVNSFLLETHGKSAKFLKDSRAATCETCHGEGTKHIENREKRIAAADIENPVELKTPEDRRRANIACLNVTLAIVVILAGKVASTTEAT